MDVKKLLRKELYEAYEELFQLPANTHVQLTREEIAEAIENASNPYLGSPLLLCVASNLKQSDFEYAYKSDPVAAALMLANPKIEFERNLRRVLKLEDEFGEVLHRVVLSIVRRNQIEPVLETSLKILTEYKSDVYRTIETVIDEFEHCFDPITREQLKRLEGRR